MEYFKLSEFNNYKSGFGQKYASSSSGAKLYYDTRDKLRYLAQLISDKLGCKIEVNYTEKPNKQAGKGKGFSLKEYILIGFMPKDLNIKDKNIFLKLEFSSFEKIPVFAINVDINFSDPNNPYQRDRDDLQNGTYWECKVDEYFPKNWEDLINFISPIVKKNIEFLEVYLKKEVLFLKKSTTTMKNNYPLNQILFGPPGTGKTYNTINKALSIIENIKEKELSKENRIELKNRFNEFVKSNQIIFTTFHQSMSYEDFIEGIKPIEPKQEGHSVIYKIVDGIFKRACAIAAYNCYRKYTKSKTLSYKYSFDDLYEAFTVSIQKQLDEQRPPVYKSLRGRDVEVKEINSNDSIIARAKNSIAKSSAPLTKENMQKLYDRFNKIEDVVDLQQVQETVQITPRITEFYAVFSGLKEFERTFKPDEQLIIENNEFEVLDFEEIQKKFNAGVYKEAIKLFGKHADPVVVIVDEINRGNVSQIFGELITLIEEDKRLGKEEALEVTLPYSKEKFGVPPNLFIIGTMNTADRSVEALDAALRRRFSFVEMPPKPELLSPGYMFWNLLWKFNDVGWDNDEYVSKEKHLLDFLGAKENIWESRKSLWVEFKKENKNEIQSTKFKDDDFSGVNLKILLQTINKRIEKLLDKDHQIGHSYFISVLNLLDLKLAFQNKIIPLLQEYFFGDYGKIGLVLGKGFLEPVESVQENIFADFDDYDASEFSERTIYKIRELANMSDEDFINAIYTLLKK